MSALCFDTDRMKLSQVQNREFHMHSIRVYNEIKTLGLDTVEKREQEYVLRMNALPSHIRFIEFDTQHKQPVSSPKTLHVSSAPIAPDTSSMRPPRINFDDEVDITEYYEGSSVNVDNQVRYVNFMKQKGMKMKGSACSA